MMKLYEAIKRAGMSAEVLAVLIDVSTDTMQEYLAGIRKIHHFKKKKICRILRTENILWPIPQMSTSRSPMTNRISVVVNREMYLILHKRIKKEKISLSEGVRKAIKKYTRS